MTKTSYYKPHEEIQVLEKLLHSGCVYTRDVLQSSQQMEAGLLAWAVTPSFFIMWRAYNPSCHHSTPFCASDVNILFSAGCLLFTCLCAVTGNLILIIKHHKQQILNVLMYLNMSTLTTIFMVQYVPQCAYLVMKWLWCRRENGSSPPVFDREHLFSLHRGKWGNGERVFPERPKSPKYLCFSLTQFF